MNGLLGAAAALAMMLITGSLIRGPLAFLVTVAVLVGFRRINSERCWYCSCATNERTGEDDEQN